MTISITASLIIGIIGIICNDKIVSVIDYEYGIYLLSILSGIGMSLTTILIAVVVEHSKIFEFIGQNTYGILIFHKPILIICQSKLGFVTIILKNGGFILEIIVASIITVISIIFSLTVYKIFKKFFPLCVGAKK